MTNVDCEATDCIYYDGNYGCKLIRITIDEAFECKDYQDKDTV